MIKIKGLEFYETCSACPEQYEVYDSNDNHVGYVRLRWGYLKCNYPDVDGETIYFVEFDDGWMGRFESEEQREKYLNNIADKILEKIGDEY